MPQTIEETGKVGVVEALRAVLQEDFPDDVSISRITIRLMATGEVPYRLHPSDGSDYIGGVARVE